MMFRTTVLWGLLAAVAARAEGEMPWVSVSDDGQRFVLSDSQQRFTPWGFNYDHDRDGRLLEEYWYDQWPTVEADFQEMKDLGANVVRIHLQFGAFMEGPDRPRQRALDQLARLVELAERTGVYLDLTGLGCYHKPDVPAWYDRMSEAERWAAQAAFWEAVAKTCADSPAIFCYDLMNEPVVPGGDKPREDWLGPGFGDKHFVQFITLDAGGRERSEIARQWIGKLSDAIRRHDQRHLITVGLVPWSLDRPGMTSGFVPERIADRLDFIAMHLYPERGKIDEALETLEGFAEAGKPVVIEETFPLKCGAEELVEFFERSREHAAGWISFYWGTTIEQYREKDESTIGDAIARDWLQRFREMTPRMRSAYRSAACEGRYRHHLQGVCVDRDAIYWSFTTQLVKTDREGNRLEQVPVDNHHGDLCWRDGRLYVAVNLGKFNDPAGNADSWVYEYDASDLSLLEKHPVPEVFHGAGGIDSRDGHFFVVGGLPDGVEENYLYEYDDDFQFVAKHVLESGHTHLGIQTATFADGRWWFGCYGDPKILLVADADFQMQGRYRFDGSLGITGLPGGWLLAASGRCEGNDGCSGSVRLAVPDDASGLRYASPPPSTSSSK